MKQTEYLQLNQPDPTDFYNIADFNENAAIVDTAMAELAAKQQWQEVELASFVSLMELPDGSWDGKVYYHPATGLCRVRLQNEMTGGGFVTGEAFGTVQPAYRPMFEETGTAVFVGSGRESIETAVRLSPDGVLRLAPVGMPQSVDAVPQLDLFYAVKGA